MQKFAILLSMLLAGSSLSSAQDQDFSKVQIKVTKVAGNVFMLEGEGGNIAVSVGEDGIVVVDDQYAPLADRIQAALKDISDKPIRFIINTHYHADHVGGNEYFQKQAPIIAHDNVRKRLEEGGTVGNLSSLKFETKPMAKPGLPILTFGQDVTIHLNGEDIHVLHIPHGHTDGDSIIFFPKSNVVHMGDDFLRIGFPFIDLASGGSVRGLIAGLEEIVLKLPPDVKVIPGHGVISNLNDVRACVKMLKETLSVVEQGVKRGKSLEQLKQEKVLEAWKQLSNDFISTDAFIETLYNDLIGKPGTFIKHN
jgi:glyoxylase-like metal-dependent hydrolase (beta-lactamase superfamily II)